MSDTTEGGGLPGGLSTLVQKAKEIQERLGDMQSRLSSRTAVGEAGGGMVKVTVNGKQQVLRVEIEPEVIDPSERDMLQDLIVAATNQALAAVQREIAEEMQQASGGLNIPGLF